MCGWCQRVCGAEESCGVSGGIGGSGTDAAGGFFGRDAAADGSDAAGREAAGDEAIIGADAAGISSFGGMGRAARSDVNHQVPTKSAPRIKPIMSPLMGNTGAGGADGGLPEIRVVGADSLAGRDCVGRLRTWVADAACSADACTKISEVLS